MKYGFVQNLCYKKQYYKNKEGECIMNKAELITAIAEKANLNKKDADAAVKAFTDIVMSEVAKDGMVQLVGFGTFERATRAAREGRNPQTGESLSIPAVNVPKFKAGRTFKDMVN